MILSDRIRLTILKKMAEIGKTPDAYFKYAFKMYNVFAYSRNDISADKVLEAFTIASQAGSADASLQLYKIFSGEDEIITNKIDDVNARMYLKLAAEKGNAEAQHLYGRHLMNSGETIEAKKWLSVASENGNGDAENTMSELKIIEKNDVAKNLYIEGIKCLELLDNSSKEKARIEERAISYFETAANEGMVEAKYELALLYLRHEEQKHKAVKLLVEAYQQGSADAAFKLYELANDDAKILNKIRSIGNELLGIAVERGSIAALICETKNYLNNNKDENDYKNNVELYFFMIHVTLEKMFENPSIMAHKVLRDRMEQYIVDYLQLANYNIKPNALDKLVENGLKKITMKDITDAELNPYRMAEKALNEAKKVED